jgi:tryptophan synthase alpha chain
MDRYLTLFNQLSSTQHGAFVPFVTIGDPDLETSYDIICTLIESGADALELGIPFSDPIADGPTIQAANIRALNQDISTEKCLALIGKVRDKYPDTPIGLLLYSNLVLAQGIDNFYQRCQHYGIDSVLVADVPVRESAPFKAAANKAGVKAVFIVPPSVSDAKIEEISAQSEGYTYLLSRAGVTGSETKANMPAHELISKLEQFNAPPAVLGFGISKPEQVHEAISAGAKGAISGSAVVKIIEENLNDKKDMLNHLSQFVKEMKAAS